MHKWCLCSILPISLFYIQYCSGFDLGVRLDLMPPCVENEKNSARFGATELLRVHPNKYQVNGTLIVDRTVTGPLQVSRLACNSMYHIYVI